MTIKAVIFDLDDTLLWDDRCVKEAFEVTCESVKQHYDIDSVKLEEAVRQEARALYESYETFEYTKNIGINPFEALWGNFNDENEHFSRLKQIAPEYRKEAWTRGLKVIGIDDLQLGETLGELFPSERRARTYVYDATYPTLDILKENHKLMLLTNGSPDIQNEKLAALPKLTPYMDQIMVSGSFGQGKPSPAIFEHAMSLLGIEAHEGIMVGDKLTTDIKGALSVGMKCVWVNRKNMEPSDKIKPDYEIKELNELHEVIESINQKALL
ncbi:HAD family hydrolase [Chengkuizengella axinellae]|uniref:Phosphoserine phosphatase n=1 Tax=Chengkuizengella axinellae TaxID=3064388 RepID=A0ABT9IXD0_9BACL|nr:HAD-IA family hydrolase [Chengkuizengella sp. 2205SS18-9]MDP5274031.1 HAD-IA family hydrolase [Chengkuizengella sp. 2205SS18-9]